MKKTKLITTALIFSISFMNISPLFAFAAKTAKTDKKVTQQNALKANVVSYINMDWWNVYNDEYLSDYIMKALDKNQDLKIASLNVEEARQNVKIGLSNELPSLSVGVSPLLYKMPGVSNTDGLFSVPLIASYEADIFLKNHDKTKSSKKLYEATQLKEKATYIAVISSVGATYYNLVKIDKLIDIQEQIINDRKQIFDLMKQSNKEGIVSTSDLVKAEKAYVASTSDLIELKKAREIMLNSLAVLTGDSPENSHGFKRINYDKLVYTRNIPESIPSSIIENRPDYLAAEKMVEKAGIDVRVAKKEFLPTINIIGLLGFNAGGSYSAMNWKNSLALLAGSAMLPIFTGGKRIANLKIMKTRYEQVLQNYYKTNLTAIQEVNDSLSNVKLDNEKFEKNLKTLQMEQKDFKYTEAKYNQGTISYLDLLQHKENLLDMQKMVVSSKTNCLISQISLYKAVAGENL